jgi:hypothetical protein
MVNLWDVQKKIGHLPTFADPWATTYLGKFDHDLTDLPNPGMMFSKGNIIPMWGLILG